MKMLEQNSQKLKHKDRVICNSNKKLHGKVFTIYAIPEYPYLRLFQNNENLLFTKTGTCIQTPRTSLFREGDQLNFYKSDSDY